jgi:hypothetical protein
MDKPMLEYVLERLDESKGRLPTVAAESGVPYRTLQKIANRDTEDPGVSHIQRLHDYYRAQRAEAA